MFQRSIQQEPKQSASAGCRQAIQASGNPDDLDIFVVERDGEGWSDPVPVCSMINTSGIERIHCFTTSGDFYFSRNPFTRNEVVCVSRWAEGEFDEPGELGSEVNSEASEFVIVFGPDEDYMLINQQAEAAAANVFISYRKSDGSWSERIGTPCYSGGFLALSPDGKYLFTMEEGIYWVNTSFVEDLKPDGLR